MIPEPWAGSAASGMALPLGQDIMESEAEPTSPAFMRKNCVSWIVQDVAAALNFLDLPHLVPDVERSGLDGGLIACVSWEELRQDLNWTPLQMKKFVHFWESRARAQST